MILMVAVSLVGESGVGGGGWGVHRPSLAETIENPPTKTMMNVPTNSAEAAGDAAV